MSLHMQSVNGHFGDSQIKLLNNSPVFLTQYAIQNATQWVFELMRLPLSYSNGCDNIDTSNAPENYSNSHLKKHGVATRHRMLWYPEH
jgi:hypothetical protein